MKIAIDGPAGSGKSTVARALAGKCGVTYLDTGAMYRSVTVACLETGTDVADAEAVAKLAQDAKIEFGTAADGTQTVALNGRDVTAAIRTPQTDRNVSAVSAIPAVREAMVAQQRAIAGQKDVVAEGRDIGTVVFPDAEVKVFLTADPKARAHRRAVQREGGDAAKDPAATADAAQEQQILADLERRDKLDSSREVAPLKPAEDAVHIDSSALSVDEVVAQIMALIDAAKKPAEPAAADTPAAAETPAADKPAPKPAAKKAEKPAAKKPEKPAAPAGPMRPFHGNSFDDYYDHAMRDYPWNTRGFIGFAVGVVGGVTKLLWPWRIEDGQKLWKAEGGRVIVMNHVSMLEPVIMVVTEWVHGRRVRAVYKSEFDKAKPLTWLFSRAGAFPVERGTADMKVVRRAREALKRGEDVLIYPEGTRIKSDDQEVTLHAGFALMAQLAKVPVLPVAIVGARDITTPTRKFPHFHRVFVKVGDPITFAELNVKGRKQQAKAMEKAAMDRVYGLRAELRQEHPGKE